MFTKIAIVAVRCSNQEKSVKFYQDVLGIPVRGEIPEISWVELGFTPTSTGIALVEVAQEGSPQEDSSVTNGPGTMEIIIESDNIDKDYEDLLDKGVVFAQPPEQEHWGGVLANFRGPDGENITLVQLPFH